MKRNPMLNKEEKQIFFQSDNPEIEAVFTPDWEGFSELKLDIEPSWFPGTDDFFCVEQYPSIVNCTEAEYHRIQAYSNSFGSTLLTEAPWYQKAWEGIKPSPEMILGSATELYVELLYELKKDQSFVDLDRTNWNVGKILKHVAVMPFWKGEGSGNNRKAFREQHPGKLIITTKEFDTIMTMLKSSLDNSDFSNYLDGTWQTVILWIEDGIPMKAMLDHVTQNEITRHIKTPGDLKTTDIANPRTFHKKMYDRNLDMQAYHYTAALKELYPGEDIGKFFWYVLETKDPFGSVVYYADEVVLESGRAKRERALNIARDLHANGDLSEFPNYAPDGPKELSLYDWQIDKSLRLELEDSNE